MRPELIVESNEGDLGNLVSSRKKIQIPEVYKNEETPPLLINFFTKVQPTSMLYTPYPLLAVLLPIF